LTADRRYTGARPRHGAARQPAMKPSRPRSRGQPERGRVRERGGEGKGPRPLCRRPGHPAGSRRRKQREGQTQRLGKAHRLAGSSPRAARAGRDQGAIEQAVGPKRVNAVSAKTTAWPGASHPEPKASTKDEDDSGDGRGKARPRGSMHEGPQWIRGLGAGWGPRCASGDVARCVDDEGRGCAPESSGRGPRRGDQATSIST
jgi:hypothetical protein